jgi:hypothetical protein
MEHTHGVHASSDEAKGHPLVIAISTTVAARAGLLVRDRRGLEEARMNCCESDATRRAKRVQVIVLVTVVVVLAVVGLVR